MLGLGLMCERGLVHVMMVASIHPPIHSYTIDRYTQTQMQMQMQTHRGRALKQELIHLLVLNVPEPVQPPACVCFFGDDI